MFYLLYEVVFYAISPYKLALRYCTGGLVDITLLLPVLVTTTVL